MNEQPTMKNDEPKSGKSDLRHQAEEALLQNPPSVLKTDGDAKRLIHELQVHQIELEMQNEELHRAQEDLAAAHDRYFDFFDLAPVGYFVLSEKGVILNANLIGAKLLGVERSELMYKRLTHFILAEDQDIFYLVRRRAYEARLQQSCELRMVKKDGSQFHANLECARVSDKGEITSLLRIVLSDVTERKQVRESEEVFRILADSNPVIIWMSNAEGGTQFVNRAYREFFGVSLEQVKGSKWQPLVHPDDAAAYVEAYLRSAREHTAFNAIARVRRADGEWRWVASYGEPRFSSAGEFLGHVGNSPDITEQKHIEEELERRVQNRTDELQTVNEALKAEVVERVQAEEVIRQQAKRAETQAEISHSLAAASFDLPTVFGVITRSAAECIGDSCLIHMLSEDGQWLNPAAIYFPDPAVQERLFNVISSLSLRVGEGLAGQVIQSGKSVMLSTVTPQQLAAMTVPGYQPVIEELQLSHALVVPLIQDGKSLGTLGLYRAHHSAPYTLADLQFLESLADRTVLSITKARLYQDLKDALQREQQIHLQLIQSEKNSALVRMVASIAHEINNPIQTIKNCMFLLQEEINPASGAMETLDMATSEANRIGDLVTRLRELYKPLKEQPSKPFNVIDVLKNIYSLLVHHLQQHNVRWELLCDTDKAIVKGNADQIKQVFLNICLNAIDAVESDEGVLSVEVSTSTPSSVCVSFKDNGKGILPEDLPHIFEPFYTTKDTGSGLGLSICYEIVKNVNGDITVESQPGKGATFNVCLPRI